jgi:1,2-diacylglycerol 3-beta-galactosyltransferase
LRKKLRQVLEPKPALVASFHPLLNHVAVDVIPQTVPRVTVITDWIRFHRAWTDLQADRIICPSDAAYALCRTRGVPASRLSKAGLPIHPHFSQAIARFSDRQAARRALYLRPHAPTVLLVGGGDGTEPLRRYARALAQLPLGLQILAVCGRNDALAHRIREDNHSGVHVYGFVDNMPDLMLAADVLVTRAGPGMIAEGLACGCPLLLTGCLPGQEDGNVEEVVARQLGDYVPRTSALVAAIERWFAKSEPERQADAERARAAGDPQAAFRVAEIMVELIDRP